MSKELAYKDEAGSLYLEYHPYYGVLIHCEIYQWSRKTIRHFYEVWEEFLNELSEKGYDKLYALVGDKKLRKFATMYGFESTGTFLHAEGKDREVMVCCFA